MLAFSSSVAVAVATLTAAALFSPLRLRFQRVVDRRFNRSRYDAEETTTAFAGRLKEAVDLDSVHDDLVNVVQQAPEPAHLGVDKPPSRPFGGAVTGARGYCPPGSPEVKRRSPRGFGAGGRLSQVTWLWQPAHKSVQAATTIRSGLGHAGWVVQVGRAVAGRRAAAGMADTTFSRSSPWPSKACRGQARQVISMPSASGNSTET